MTDKEKPDYKAINGQVAKLVFDVKDGKWKATRYLCTRERLPVVASTGCVRPQQAARLVGGTAGRQRRTA